MAYFHPLLGVLDFQIESSAQLLIKFDSLMQNLLTLLFRWEKIGSIAIDN
jgi:hypothetical protein